MESEKIEQIRAVLEAWEQATEGSTGKDVFNKIGGICFDAEADISDLEADVYAELQSDYTNIDFANDTIQDIVEHLNK